MYINFVKVENKNKYITLWLLLITLLVAIIIIIGGLTRLTDSGLSIAKCDLFVGIVPPLSQSDWNNLFLLYQKIPEFKIQNSTMTLQEFKLIFWWEYAHRLIGRILGLTFIFPLLRFFSINDCGNSHTLCLNHLSKREFKKLLLTEKDFFIKIYFQATN